MSEASDKKIHELQRRLYVQAFDCAACREVMHELFGALRQAYREIERLTTEVEELTKYINGQREGGRHGQEER